MRTAARDDVTRRAEHEAQDHAEHRSRQDSEGCQGTHHFQEADRRHRTDYLIARPSITKGDECIQAICGAHSRPMHGTPTPALVFVALAARPLKETEHPD